MRDVLLGIAAALGLLVWIVFEARGQANTPAEQERQTAALERERLDPVPRSDLERFLRRQMPVEAEFYDSDAEVPDRRNEPPGEPESLEIIRRQSA